MNNRQLGIITIAVQEIEDRPDSVADLFGFLRFVPVRCECNWSRNRFEYIGICDRFTEVPRSERVPRYDITIEGTFDTSVTVTVERAGEQPWDHDA